MIYKREDFIEECPEDARFPIKQVEQLTSLDGQTRRFIGRVSLGVQTGLGMSTIPVTFEIEASSVSEAFSKFNARAEEEIERTRREIESQIQEVRRKAQSRIVTPGEIGPLDLGKLKT